jgi:hypothetical protein
LIWTIALTNIYRSTHSRIAASRWIYANIPCGATIANEHWDDALPLGLDGRGFSPCYTGIEMANYGVDNQQKINETIRNLERADYLVLSSNRLYGNIPRLPRRYPFTIEYYRMLFAGELGFSVAHISTSYPTIFGYEFNTDAAEEIFTVYDHPKVLIYKKDDTFNPEKLRMRFEEFPPGVIEPLVKGH